VAINVKVKNGISALMTAGVHQLAVDWLIAAGVDVKLTANEFKFTLGPCMEAVPVTLDVLQKLNAGTLAPQAKLMLVGKLNGAIAALEEQAKEAGLTTIVDKLFVKEQQHVPKGALGALPPLAKADNALEKLQEMAAKVEKTPLSAGQFPTGAVWPVFDLKKMKTAPVTKLRDATMMYQPVEGTSKSSRYYVVGANQDVRVAARYEGHTLSVRIEGPQIAKHWDHIQAVGLKKGGDKDYASIHLGVGNDMMVANKTLGAILMGRGLPLETPLPNLKIIKA
jgi:hypothetical protein